MSSSLIGEDDEHQNLMRRQTSNTSSMSSTFPLRDSLTYCVKCSADRKRQKRLRFPGRLSRARRRNLASANHCECCGSSLNNDDDVENAIDETAASTPSRMCCFSRGKKAPEIDRLVNVGVWSSSSKSGRFGGATNAIRNRKYNPITFIPLVLFQQFRMFLNFYFLVMALSQFIPSIRVGYLYTYWGPLVFVLVVTIIREAYDDIKRAKRDTEVNLEMYKCWRKSDDCWVAMDVAAEKIQIGDLVVIGPDQRVPADLVLLYSQVSPGTCFLRTDQLDGETDWKLRVACGFSQRVISAALSESYLPECLKNATIRAGPPSKSLDQFEGIFICGDDCEEPLSVENMLWSSTVVATRHPVIGCAIYIGPDTRMAMNTTKSRAKIGLLDLEINRLTKLLFAFVLVLSTVMIILKGFHGPWYRYLFRFVLLFSYIIPISLRVNMDLGKMVYAYFISNDSKHCPGTVVRSSTIPEELGRISYLLSDKTGTLTKNEMVFKRVHLGTIAFGTDNLQDLRLMLAQDQIESDDVHLHHQSSRKYSSFAAVRRTTAARVREVVQAIAVCHNVMLDDSSDRKEYQASSPDEVCLVRFCESVGLRLWKRDADSIVLSQRENESFLRFTLLHVFPFTSELKRMGLLVRDEQTQQIIFYIKGADSAIAPMVTTSKNSDWLTEETSNMAREGLRILVYGYRVLTPEQYALFDQHYISAQLSVGERSTKCREAIEQHLETDIELLCVTGVEDSLQVDVRPTLEALRNAGIRVWMLTGDKMETAACIARSSRLFTGGRDQIIHFFPQTPLTAQRIDEELEELSSLSSSARANAFGLIISGSSLHAALDYNEKQFISAASRASAVVVCRCSPTQKADVVDALKRQTNRRVATVGDGGNDVSMIQKAHAGIGIVGKEGHQASLAADFSIQQFSHIKPLLLIHGRNCYKRSAALAQFVMHRGLVISIMQAVFSSIFYSASIPLYQGFLMVGYATIYTMFPVFSLVLDMDVSPEVALTFPEIYAELQKGRSLNFKTFSIWALISMYQGGIIIYLSLLLFEDDFIHVVSITFTSLILTELIMVAITIRHWHYLMIVGELLSLLCYAISLVVFRSYFDAEFLTSFTFLWKVTAITAVSCLPLYIIKVLQLRLSPSIHAKLMQVSGSGGVAGFSPQTSSLFASIITSTRPRTSGQSTSNNPTTTNNNNELTNQTPNNTDFAGSGKGGGNN